MKQEVECIEIRELVALNLSLDHPAEMIGYPIPRDELIQHFVPLRLQRDHTNVRSVTLVAGAGVSDVEKADLHWMMSTLVFTTALSISAGQ